MQLRCISAKCFGYSQKNVGDATKTIAVMGRKKCMWCKVGAMASRRYMSGDERTWVNNTVSRQQLIYRNRGTR